MTDIAIRVENLGKRYRIGVGSQGAFRYKSLRDSLAGAVTAPFRRLTRPSVPPADHVSAPKDVSIGDRFDRRAQFD
jgi:hypothetical protein